MKIEKGKNWNSSNILVFFAFLFVNLIIILSYIFRSSEPNNYFLFPFMLGQGFMWIIIRRLK